MSKIAEAFRNPATRARAYIWTGVSVVIFGVFFFLIIAFTSSYFFCANICHAVQDDSIYSYQNSTHRTVSCLACHMPAGADPVTFMLHKAVALQEIPMTLMGTYEIPLNKGSHLSQNPDHMGSIQCTQCHDLSKRNVTPSAGILIDHKAHAEENISCTICHNRIAHNETDRDFQFVNVDPNSGELNTGHPDMSGMTGCMRCHRVDGDGQVEESPFEATGACEACHTPEFDLVPEDHKAEGWKSAHGDAANEEAVHVAEVAAELEAEGGHEAEPKSDEAKATAHVPNIEVMNECYTCHSKTFCSDCHGGVEMPHPGNFLDNHREEAQKNEAACITCHGQDSCNNCHHGEANVPGWTFETTRPWLNQHDEAAYKSGAALCLECHTDPTFCAACHVRGGR